MLPSEFYFEYDLLYRLYCWNNWPGIWTEFSERCSQLRNRFKAQASLGENLHYINSALEKDFLHIRHVRNSGTVRKQEQAAKRRWEADVQRRHHEFPEGKMQQAEQMRKKRTLLNTERWYRAGDSQGHEIGEWVIEYFNNIRM